MKQFKKRVTISMGKKSRLKQLKRQGQQRESVERVRPVREVKAKGLESFLLWLVRLGTAAAMFTPLVLYDRYYFPFVGPKGLYLMGCLQVVFFAWLFLALHYKRYRPNINTVLTAFVFFLLVLILSSLLGVDPSRSFWSKYERMTGLVMWLHLFAWFLAISSALRKLSDWRRIFWVSLGVAGLIAFLTLLGEVDIAVWKQGGSSLGNTSFLGTYLLFNVFFALYLFWQEKNKYLKILALVVAVLSGAEIYFAGARAATLGMVGALGLICLLYFAFKPKKRGVRMAGKVVLVASSLTVFVLVVLLFVPGTFVSNKFIELTTASRAVNWQMAWQGFLEKPLFGWGPENYILLFPKFFNPCLFTAKCGGEIWFDRTHNVIFDALSTTGIFGLLAYIGLFGAMSYVLLKKYLKEKLISFWTFSIFLALLAAYFVQNLTVFDMPATLMLFVFTLGFVAFLARPVRGEASNGAGKEKCKKSAAVQTKPTRIWAGVVLFVVFLITFFEFVIQPARADGFVIKAVTAHSPQERLEYYKKTFEASSLGKYQIRDFFAQHTQNFVRENLQKAPQDVLVKELDFVTQELVKTRKESPLDFRATLKLAQIYNIYALLDANQLVLAERYCKEALDLSPINQQAIWCLAQTKVYQGDFQTALDLAQTAIDLEPEWFDSHKIAVQVAKTAGDDAGAKEIAQKAVTINPEWLTEFSDVLGSPR